MATGNTGDRRCRQPCPADPASLFCERPQGHNGPHRATRATGSIGADVYGYEIYWPPPDDLRALEDADAMRDGEPVQLAPGPARDHRCVACGDRQATHYDFDRDGWGFALCDECQIDKGEAQ